MKRFLLAAIFAFPLAGGAQTREQSIGCWVMSSKPGENLQLNRDGNFTFNDYNTNTKSFETMYGTWKQNLNKLTLMYDDRPQQVFTIRKSGSAWTLTKAGGFLFTKATPADCSAEQ